MSQKLKKTNQLAYFSTGHTNLIIGEIII